MGFHRLSFISHDWFSSIEQSLQFNGILAYENSSRRVEMFSDVENRRSFVGLAKLTQINLRLYLMIVLFIQLWPIYTFQKIFFVDEVRRTEIWGHCIQSAWFGWDHCCVAVEVGANLAVLVSMDAFEESSVVLFRVSETIYIYVYFSQLYKIYSLVVSRLDQFFFRRKQSLLKVICNIILHFFGPPA